MITKKIYLSILVFSIFGNLLFAGLNSINSKAKNCIYEKTTISQNSLIAASRENNTRTGLEETSVAIGTAACVHVSVGSVVDMDKAITLNRSLRTKKLD
jgi:hypothetical protein